MKRYLILIAVAAILLLQWSDDPTQPVNLFTGRVFPGVEYIEKFGSDKIVVVAWDQTFYISSNPPGEQIEAGGLGFYLQMIDMDGNLHWGTGGKKLESSGAFINAVFFVPINEDSIFIITFEGSYPFSPGIELNNGLPSGMPGKSGSSGYRQDLIPGNGGGQRCLRINKMDVAGNMLWGDGIKYNLPDEIYLWNYVSDGDGGFYFLLEDYSDRNTGPKFYLNHIDKDGQLSWGLWDVPITTNRYRYWQEPRIVLCENGDGVIVSWSKAPDPYEEVLVQHFSSAGVPLWQSPGIKVRSGVAGSVPDHYLCSDGAGGAIVGWQDTRTWSYPARLLFAQRVDSAGNVMWKENGILTGSGSIPKKLYYIPWMYSYMISDGEGGAIFLWKANEGILVQRVGSDGAIKFNPKGVVVDDRWKYDSWWVEMNMTLTSPGKFLVAWSNANSAWAQEYNMNGEPQWQKDFQYNIGGLDLWAYPVYDGNDGVVMLYNSQNWNRYDWRAYVYANHIKSDGKLGTSCQNDTTKKIKDESSGRKIINE